MKSETRRARRLWLFERQRHVCCLQITTKCKALGGAMQIDEPHRRDYATFEHLIPQSKMRRSGGRVHDTVLLACARCNAKKKNHMADLELIAYSRTLFLEWKRFESEQALVAKDDQVRAA